MTCQVQAKRYLWNELNEIDPVINEATVNKEVVQLLEKITSSVPLADTECHGGIYTGMGGVAYALWHAANNLRGQQRKMALNYATQYIRYHVLYDHEHGDRCEEWSFVTGHLGLLVVAALIYSDTQQPAAVDQCLTRLANIAHKVMPLKFRSGGSDELFVGRMGYLCGILAVRRHVNVPVVSDDVIVNIMRSTVESGRRHARACARLPLMYSYYDTDYLGAAHGLSSILHILLCFPTLLARVDAKAWNDVKCSVDYVVSLQQESGHFECDLDDVQNGGSEAGDQLVHWCHGAPGIIHLLARAHKVYGGHTYLNACLKAGDIVWQKGLLKKGPGLCHGISGNAYVFLVLYQLTNNSKYLKRAHLFAKFIQNDKFSEYLMRPDNPWSLYEGLAGYLCLLSDLLDPQHATFPFSPFNL